jgi:hypothetical protein
MKIYIVLALLCLSSGLLAESKWDYLNQPNELRIGWGDQMFESLMWHNSTYTVRTMPMSYVQLYHENYRYDQHIWLEYQRRFGFGVMLDWSDVRWDDVTRNGFGTEIARSPGHMFYNIVLMPTIRFTYYHHPNVNLYSGLGIGMDINGGTERNAKGHKTDIGGAVNFTVFGVSANYKRWFATVDFGGMYALKNTETIFLASSRIINVSIGARF